MKTCEPESLNREHDPEFVLIPLGLESLGTGVFEETPGEPIGLVVKAHFLMEAGCLVRARLMLELVKELGSADEAVLVTLASLQVREGLIEEAADNLKLIPQQHAAYPNSLICRVELERYSGGLRHAIAFLSQHKHAALPELEKYLRYLQDTVIK